MSAAGNAAVCLPVEALAPRDDFWDHPRSSREFRERIREALARMKKLGIRAS